MESFPSYDYPLWGNTSESAGLSSGNEDFPYGADYGGAGTAKPAPPFTLGVVYDDATSGIKSMIGGAYRSVTGELKSAYWNLIGGVAIIGILAILVLGISGRLLRQIEGR